MNCCYCVVHAAFNLSVCRIDMKYRHNMLFTMHIIDGNTDKLCSLVYSKGEENCSHITDGNTDIMISSVYSRGEENYSHITDGNIDGHSSLVYSRGQGNCSHLMPVMLIKVLWISCRLPRELPMDCITQSAGN